MTGGMPGPMIEGGVVDARALPPEAGLRAAASDGTPLDLTPLGGTGLVRLGPTGADGVVLTWRALDGTERRATYQLGGFAGRVEGATGLRVTGWARNLRAPAQDCAVGAIGPAGLVAHATARADRDGRFELILPPGPRLGLRLGVLGSDHMLEDGTLPDLVGTAAPRDAVRRPAAVRVPTRALTIRIKICCPDLREAPLWGDFHFANALAAAFERIGHAAAVDTADMWDAQPADEDVVLMIRGRHRYPVDPAKINLMWIISHPDRMVADEMGDYDHVAVASDVHAAALARQGHGHVSALHQAVDAPAFADAGQTERKAACLFVGNSRREYRRMVRWAMEAGAPLDLYGGGWEGILPDAALRAPSLPNDQLPAAYGGHLLVLNDHWDSMRDNGFLSNRLFDASATGTPVLTDPVAGLADVFGDSIAVAADMEGFRAQVADCMAHPDIWLDRAAEARRIVLDAHTFDHRAAEWAAIIERVAAVKRPYG